MKNKRKIFIEKTVTNYIKNCREDVLEVMLNLREATTSGEVRKEGRRLMNEGLMVDRRTSDCVPYFARHGRWSWNSFSDRTLRHLRHLVKRGFLVEEKIEGRGNCKSIFKYIG